MQNARDKARREQLTSVIKLIRTAVGPGLTSVLTGKCCVHFNKEDIASVKDRLRRLATDVTPNNDAFRIQGAWAVVSEKGFIIVS